MKKIRTLFAGLAISAFALTSCGNMSRGLGNYTFKHIHFGRNGIDYSATVEKWYDTENPGLEVKTEEYGALFLSEGTYELFESENKCPYCTDK